jgi:hypothetical protein
MRITFTAFTENAIVRGELVFVGDRLTDFIRQDGAFEIEDVTLEALEDGHIVSASSTTVARSDLIAITGSGPRGNAARRIRTRPYAARAQAGPYEIVGYVHAPPSAHPLNGVLRRRVLPMTSAVVRYRIGERVVEESHDAVLMNPSRIEWLAAATDQDLRVGKSLELAKKLDPRAKEMTSEPIF